MRLKICLTFVAGLFFALSLWPCVSHAFTEEATASFMPWSGYWWPTASGGLATGIGYRSHPAPLEKYDLITSGIQIGPATSHYLQNSYNPDALSWAGLCDAWSAAAVSESIEFKPSSVNNLFFHIGDKKGLLTAAHELDFTRATSASMDSPLVLHTWLQTYLRDQGVAFYAELDPSEQIWNYPICKYRMDISDFGDEVYVVCQIWYADDLVDPDYNGTKLLTKTYRYRLFESGNTYSGGEWLIPSTYDHPEKLVRPQEQLANNPYLDYDTIKNLAVSVDDAVESDLPVALNPGGYNLVLLNRDRYILNAGTGDKVLLSLSKIDSSDELIQISITDKTGASIYTGDLGNRIIPLDYGTPPFELIVEKNNYDTPGLYRLDYDLAQAFEYVRPKTQKGWGWGGYAMCNSSDAPIDGIMVTGCSDTGEPVDTFLGPFSLEPGGKQTLFTSDLPFRNALEKENFSGIKIHAPKPLGIVNLSGVYSSNMATFAGAITANRIVIPDYPKVFDYTQSRFWGLYNPEIRSTDIKLFLFSGNGELAQSVDSQLPSRGMVQYGLGVSPFQVTGNDEWVLIESEKSVTGYIEWVASNARSNEVMPALVPGNQFVLPHPAVSNGWGTRMVMINVTAQTNIVTLQLLAQDEVLGVELELTPHEKISLDIQDVFPQLGRDQISNSVLKINSGGDMAGYYIYSTSQAEDTAVVPLSGDETFSGSALIPHLACTDDWWTGFNLCNTGDVSLDISLVPYGAQGMPLTDQIKNISLEPGSKYVNDLSVLFGADVSDIAFVKIQGPAGSSMFGSYGYGNRSMTMLTSAKLN